MFLHNTKEELHVKFCRWWWWFTWSYFAIYL